MELESPKSIGRHRMIDLSDSCSELDKEDSIDILNKAISPISNQLEEELKNR
jgi:hypothetical protein